MRMEFTIDMHGVKSEKDVMLRFADVLKIENFYGNSWDAFFDDMRSLETESKIIREAPEMVDEVLLVVLSTFDIAHHVSDKCYSLLSEILLECTDPTEQDQIKKFYVQVQRSCTHPEHAR